MLRRGSNGFHTMSNCSHFLKRSLFLYSTSAVSSKNGIKQSIMVEFLVNSTGFSEEEALAIVTKVRFPFVSMKKCELVVDCLIESGFDGTHIREVISRHPDVLRNNVDKTLIPKIRAFEDFGISGSKLGLIISRNPHVLAWSVEFCIVPVLETLRSLFGNNEHLVWSLLQKKSQRLFSCRTRKALPANIRLLRRYGLEIERINWLMLNTDALFLKAEFVEKLVKRVEEKLGIPRTSGLFMYGMKALTSKSKEKMEPWRGVFHGFGWSETEISTLLKKHPCSMYLSEEHVRSKLKYLMEDLGLGSEHLVTHPALLTYSMEKRILPRVAVRKTLIEQRLFKRPMGLRWFLMMGEATFMLKYVLPFKEKLPRLYEDYTRATGYSLSKT